ncbi:LysR family transcriptional regulator [Kluyvera sichuanensis]|uniref:LysR family transcriptional regulator n=1 Tax=Kluyvera sichuanensis TaxID=2725494 RepID=UPI002FD190E1
MSRAAVRLCIDPLQLSHSIKKIEERLGMTLFHRNGALRLTRSGESFALEVGKMLHAFEKAKTQALIIANGYGYTARDSSINGISKFNTQHVVTVRIL